MSRHDSLTEMSPDAAGRPLTIGQWIRQQEVYYAAVPYNANVEFPSWRSRLATDVPLAQAWELADVQHRVYDIMLAVGLGTKSVDLLTRHLRCHDIGDDSGSGRAVPCLSITVRGDAKVYQCAAKEVYRYLFETVKQIAPMDFMVEVYDESKLSDSAMYPIPSAHGLEALGDVHRVKDLQSILGSIVETQLRHDPRGLQSVRLYSMASSCEGSDGGFVPTVVARIRAGTMANWDWLMGQAADTLEVEGVEEGKLQLRLIESVDG